MYYSEFERNKKIEGLLEKLAYFSVGLDLLVAVATFFVIRGNESYALMLTISNYLLTIEVGFTVIIFVLLVAMKHYRKVVDTVALTSFRNKYSITTKSKGHKMLRFVLRIVLTPFSATR